MLCHGFVDHAFQNGDSYRKKKNLSRMHTNPSLLPFLSLIYFEHVTVHFSALKSNILETI